MLPPPKDDGNDFPWWLVLAGGIAAFFIWRIAADELYDGPFCVLSIVDNRTFKRLIYEVLDHDPTHRGRGRIAASLASPLISRQPFT